MISIVVVIKNVAQCSLIIGQLIKEYTVPVLDENVLLRISGIDGKSNEAQLV